jgi:hypothetical protein
MSRVKSEPTDIETGKRRSRLTREEWQSIYQDWADGMTHGQLAEKYGMSEASIRTRARNKDWAQLKSRSFYKDDNEAEAARLKEMSLAQMASEFRNRIGKDAMRVLKVVEGWDPTKMDINGVHMREKVLELLQKRAWASLGLDELRSVQVVNVNVMHTLAAQPAWRLRNGVTTALPEPGSEATQGRHALSQASPRGNEGGGAPFGRASVIGQTLQDFGENHDPTPLPCPTIDPDPSNLSPCPEPSPDRSEGFIDVPVIEVVETPANPEASEASSQSPRITIAQAVAAALIRKT